MRLPVPSRSEKRYQYTEAGFSPPTSTRHVQSESWEIGAACDAMTRLKSSSSATSRFNLNFGVRTGWGQRVQRRTLLLSGSPEATPSGNRSRRWRHATREPEGDKFPHAAVALSARAISRKDRRVMFVIPLLRRVCYVIHGVDHLRRLHGNPISNLRQYYPAVGTIGRAILGSTLCTKRVCLPKMVRCFELTLARSKQNRAETLRPQKPSSGVLEPASRWQAQHGSVRRTFVDPALARSYY